ncbi:uncharacterized protein LOC131588436 [Poecile atricapillus]|uniref:uncharacterized protein LOC131588436 n=1 Tax=Poecile atricapillus TaxID=48891 RepID=UPI00273A3022|nr:uncharacterized protein LOC131588436 [Poecile atricapillus]
MGPGPEPQVAAVAARGRALLALLALAESLAAPASVPPALSEAEAALGRALVAQRDLEVAQEAALAPPVAAGPSGEEDERRLRLLARLAQAAAAALESEERRARNRQRWLRAGHGLALALMVLCGAVLSLDRARAALGVADDCHLLLALAAVAASCEVARRALATSRRHLATSAGRQRDTARRLRQRAREVAATRASAEATAATAGATALLLARLEEATDALGTLVAAVTRDAAEGTPGGFPCAARALGDIAVALGTSGDGHEEVARRLRVALGALEGSG